MPVIRIPFWLATWIGVGAYGVTDMKQLPHGFFISTRPEVPRGQDRRSLAENSVAPNKTRLGFLILGFRTWTPLRSSQSRHEDEKSTSKSRKLCAFWCFLDIYSWCLPMLRVRHALSGNVLLEISQQDTTLGCTGWFSRGFPRMDLFIHSIH